MTDTPHIYEEIKDSAEKPPRKHPFIKLLGLALGLLLVYLVIQNADREAITSQLMEVRWWFFSLIAVTLLSQFTATMAWFFSFKERPGISLVMLHLIRLVGESLAQVNPTSYVAGESLKAVYLKKRYNISYKESALSLIISRYMIIIVGFLLVIVPLFVLIDLVNAIDPRLIYFILAVTLFLAVFITFYLMRSDRGFFHLVVTLLRKLFPTSQRVRSITDHLEEIDQDLTFFYKEKKFKFIAVFWLTVLHRITGAMEYYIIFLLLGIDANLLVALTLDVGLGFVKALVAFIPGQLGAEEYGNKYILSFFGITGSVWITVSILRRARQLFWIIAGLLAYLIIPLDRDTGQTSSPSS